MVVDVDLVVDITLEVVLILSDVVTVEAIVLSFFGFVIGTVRVTVVTSCIIADAVVFTVLTDVYIVVLLL